MIKRSYSFMKIHTGSDLARRRLPMMSTNSSTSGPVVWLTACAHGDEVGGIAVVQELFRLLKTRLLRGTVHAFPLMNPIGFETSSRNITVSQEDLNRSFPGDAQGSLGKRIADRIFQLIIRTSPSLVLDLHNDWIKSIPYVLLDRVTGKEETKAVKKARELALKTGFIVVAETESLHGSLSYNLLENGIPSVTLELGEPRVINEKNVQAGVKAIWNLLSSLNMVSPLGETTGYPVYPNIEQDVQIFNYLDKPYCSQSGIVRFLIQLGKEVKKGQPVAKVVNAFGKQQEILRAVQDGVVLGYTDSVAVFPGMPIIAFATPQ